MARVDFYQLTRDPAERVLPALAQKVLDRGARLFVATGDRELRDKLVDALWSAGPDTFLPSAIEASEGEKFAPIVIGDKPPGSAAGYIVALPDGNWQDSALTAGRVLFLFTKEQVEAARTPWRRLTVSGDNEERHECHYWRQERGAWAEAG